MLREFKLRTALSITLMGVLLLSFGMGLLPAQQARMHTCCSHMSMPCDSSASCCAAGPQAPAAVVTPAFHAAPPVDVDRGLLPAIGDASSRDIAAVSVTPSQSPPPGAFSLRI